MEPSSCCSLNANAASSMHSASPAADAGAGAAAP
eukprot:CAMPEP_0179177046 /NCGR_PEP_ID=MMETSP0796-20121207/87551_1 /TAXON_ID=73915 /ORGANISM="Pyrodinium bahamense, Strain pbaha01" /LENGTH=33 /DNA_ID= /DNA_START= /DNA_END= /DNA_ORIENTATION=